MGVLFENIWVWGWGDTSNLNVYYNRITEIFRLIIWGVKLFNP